MVLEFAEAGFAYVGIHDSVMTLYYAIAIYIACMFAIAFAAFMRSDWVAVAVLVLFLSGTGVLLLGIVTAALAFCRAHRGIQYEVQQSCELDKYLKLTSQILPTQSPPNPED